MGDLPLIIDLSVNEPSNSCALTEDLTASQTATILGSLEAYNHDQPSPPKPADEARHFSTADGSLTVVPPDQLLNEFTTSRRLPSPPVSSIPSSSAPLSTSPASSELSAYDAIARKFASSAGNEQQLSPGHHAPNEAFRPRSTAVSFETMKQRVEAFSSRLSTESVKAWELHPSRASAPMWERKLLSSASVLNWSNVHQPVIVLQRFIRRMRQRQTIRDAVQYHASSPTSQARVRLLGELINSERRYVTKLQIMCNSMIPRLTQVNGFDMSIFGEMHKIEYLHREILAALLKRQANQWLQMRVGDLFCYQLLPRLLLYVQYAAGYRAAMSRLVKLISSEPTIRAAVRHLEAASGAQCPPLEELLTAPLHRLADYVQILQQLLVVSGIDPGEDEYFGLSLSIVGIEQAYEDVKKHWQSYKQETKHHQLQLATGLTLPSANELQHHGALTLPDGEGCYFMLFETSLIGLRRAASGQFEVGYNLDLGQTALDTDAAPTIQSSNLRTRAIGQGNAFIVSDGASSVTLLAGTPEQKHGWVEVLEHAIQKAKRAQAEKFIQSDEVERLKEERRRRAELLEARLEDEQQITAQIGLRALTTLQTLSERFDVMAEQLEHYEETELWPMVVNVLLQRQSRPEAMKHPEVVVEEEFDALGVAALESGIHAVDETVMQKAEELIKVESQLDKGLKDAATKCWGNLEQQFERFFQDMNTLERAMDNHYAAERSKLLVNCDQIRQQTSGFESRAASIQDETKQLGEKNNELIQEIAEQSEELEMLRLRLASTVPTNN